MIAITAILWVTLVLSAYGLSMEIPVTLRSLDQGKYVFAISTNATEDGMSFHVAVTAKSGEIASDCSLSLCMVTHEKPGACQIIPVQPAIRVILKQNNRVWEADFTVPREFSQKPDLCLVFTEKHGFVVNGEKHVDSATFYEIRLQDFSSEAPVLYQNAQYDFTFSLPATWRGYSALLQQWEGHSYSAAAGKSVVTEHGPVIVLRHPQWKPSDAYQDVPILVLTRDQWEAVKQGRFSIGAGGLEYEIGHNRQYVFGIHSRYNADDSAKGWKEVADIVERNRAVSQMPHLDPDKDRDKTRAD